MMTTKEAMEDLEDMGATEVRPFLIWPFLSSGSHMYHNIGGGQVAYGDLGETDGAFGGHFDDSDEEDYDDDDDSEEESEEEEKKW